MNRTALIGLLAFAAACDLPLVMFEIEAPEVCVTRTVDVDPTTMSTGIVSGDDMLPADLAVKLSGELGTTIELENDVVELPPEAKDLLDLDVQIKLIRITALPPNEYALDDVNALSFTVNPPAGSGLSPKTVIALTSDPMGPPGAPIEARGQMFNLAEYLYAGQLTFDYSIDANVVVAVPWQVEFTACVATRGRAEASINDALDNL
jgi:hypothetical protein